MNENNEIKDLKPLSSSHEVLHLDETPKAYGSDLTNVEMQSCVFDFLSRFTILFFNLYSSSAFIIPNPQNDHKLISYIIKVCYEVITLSPSLFKDQVFSLTVIIFTLFYVVILICYGMVIAVRYRYGYVQSEFSLKLWIVIHRLLMPLPGMLIGHYMGFYLVQLTMNLHSVPILLISLITGLLWIWGCFASTFIYNSTRQNRNGDSCQIHHNYTTFLNFIYFLPLLNSLMPGFISSFIDSNYDSFIYFVISSLISICNIVFILYKRPFTTIGMNCSIIFMFLGRIPISLHWMIKEKYCDHYEFGLIFLFALLVAISFISAGLACFMKKSNSNNDENKENRESIGNNEITMMENDSIIQNPNGELDNANADTRSFPFNYISFQIQDVVNIIFLAISTFTMMLFNAFAAQRVPEVPALPDLIHDKFHVANALRLDSSYGSFQFSNIAVMTLSIMIICFFLAYPRMFNFRKMIFIYSILAIVRAFSFLVTTLPPPCAGVANCPCADSNVLKSLREEKAIVIASAWLFGLGMFLKYPECGDLIISGHTMFIWLAARTVMDMVTKTIPNPLRCLICGSILALVITAMVYIIISRNHYTIDVWFGFLFPETLWILYSTLQVTASYPPSIEDSVLTKLIRWMEKRKYPLVKSILRTDTI
ncbi:hypothetical protein TRFO_17310 [Tritrichomonas foetus]|uniref:Sphingomyelin synthase-like domain-containing protein n=1 Tax=Tritrichomonas foetus TaxID=1144522 RepID=A0A1J4KSI0_9EUKA|nr:hypothetical protein TRFO_17310 [Tritrichomonas foetus]|eukprot:OHT12764.1 hypothetical protein TRFO_17310 [Tritrichomonas foetus]